MSRTRPIFGPDGSITNLEQIKRERPPVEREYDWCGICGHDYRVHDLVGIGDKPCVGLLLATDGSQDADPCRCTGFQSTASDNSSEEGT